MSGYTIKSWFEFFVTIIINFLVVFGKMITLSMLAYSMYLCLNVDWISDDLNNYLFFLKASAVYMFGLQVISPLFKRNKEFDNSNFESLILSIVDNFISEVINLVIYTIYIFLSMYLIILMFC